MDRSRFWHLFWVPAIGAALMWLEFPSRIGIVASRTERIVFAVIGGIVFGFLSYGLDRFALPLIVKIAARRKNRPLPNEEL